MGSLRHEQSLGRGQPTATFDHVHKSPRSVAVFDGLFMNIEHRLIELTLEFLIVQWPPSMPVAHPPGFQLEEIAQ